MATRIGKYMVNHGTKFIYGAVPTKLEKPDPEGRILLTYSKDGQLMTEEYDTVLFAIGR